MGIKTDISDLSDKLDIALKAVDEACDEFEGYLAVSSQEALDLIANLEAENADLKDQIFDLKDQIADKDGEITGLEADIQRFVKELNIVNTIQQDV